MSEGNKEKKQENIVMIAACAGVLAVGILIGVLIVKQPWKSKDTDADKNKNKKTVETVSGDYDAEDCLKLGKYKGVKASIAVTQEDIDTEIESLQEENTVYTQIKGTVKDGDMVYADFEGYVNGKKVDSAGGSDYVDIGAGEWFEGFEEAFVGAKTGKAFEFDLDVPEETFGDEQLDGKKVHFKATVQYICGEEIVPEYNDDLVQSATDYKTTAEYEAYLKQELAAEYEEDKAEYSWTEVVENTEVTKYPEALMKSAKESVLQDYYNMAEMYGVSNDEIFQMFGSENEQDFTENELEELAQDTVKEQLIVQAIAKKEKITYSDEEYAAIVEEEYSYNEEEYDSQEAYEEQNKALLEEMALTAAVKNWIAEHAEFTTEASEEEQEQENQDEEE